YRGFRTFVYLDRMVCSRGLPNRRGRHAVLQNGHSSRLGTPDGARQSPGRSHCRAPEVGISADIQAQALQARMPPQAVPPRALPIPVGVFAQKKWALMPMYTGSPKDIAVTRRCV